MVQGVEIQDGCLVDLNPATGEVIARVPVSTRPEVESVLERAVDAQRRVWSNKPLDERIRLLVAGIDVLAGSVEDLAGKITEEMGKPLAEAKEEAEGAVDKAELLDLIADANRDELHGGGQSVVVRDPLGVVAVLSPWNYPSDEILLLALPALAAGNTVIVKPSEVAPVVGRMTVEAVASTLPPGVLQLVQGDGGVGAWLVGSDKVDMVAMTGSSAVGRSIMSSCAPGLKRSCA